MMAWTHLFLAWTLTNAPFQPASWMEKQIAQQITPIESSISIKNVRTSFSGVCSTYLGKCAPIIHVKFDGKQATWIAPKQMEDSYKASAETFCEAIQIVHERNPLDPFECLVCLDDQCEKPLYLRELKVPIFCMSRSKRNSKVLLIPNGLFDKQRFITYKDVMEKSARTPWKKRRKQALWRPKTVMNEYLYSQDETQPSWRLLLLGQAHPDVLDLRLGRDAEFAKIPWCANQVIEREQFAAPYLSPMQQVDYRYLVSGDQLGRLHDLEWQLFSGSIVLKVPAAQCEWFHSQLRPYQHYIPIGLYGEDLLDRIECLSEMEEEMQQMAKTALHFARENLSDHAIFSYFSHLLHMYAKKFCEKP